MRRRRSDEPAHEPLLAAVAGIIFLLIGVRHTGSLGLGFSLVGLAVIALGAITFVTQLVLWLRSKVKPSSPHR